MVENPHLYAINATIGDACLKLRAFEVSPPRPIYLVFFFSPKRTFRSHPRIPLMGAFCPLSRMIGFRHTRNGFRHTQIGFRHTQIGFRHTQIGFRHTQLGFIYSPRRVL
jgi:hypothetical protein